MAEQLMLDLTPKPIPRCCICETTENLRIAPLMTGDKFGETPKHPVCGDCYMAWHDGAGTTPEQILKHRDICKNS